MKNLTMRQLRYFDAVMRHGHFGRAAEACAVSQPALSMQIKELEDMLGYALFERNARQVVLTGLGDVFAAHARKILRAVEELENLAHISQTRPVGRLRLGVIPTVGPYFLPAVFESLLRHYPDLELHICETLTLNLIRDLHDNRLDVALVALPVSDPSLFEFPLFTEEFFLARPLREAGKPAPDPHDLRHMRLLLLQEGHCFREQALAFCGIRAHLMPAFQILDASSLSTLVQMVGVGMGVTFLPSMSIPMEGHNAAIDIIALNPPRPVRTIGMVWRKTHTLHHQFEALAETLKRTATPNTDQAGA